MVVSRRFEPPDVVSATLEGVITPSDQSELVSFARAAIRVAGSVRVLLRLERFAGWNPDAGFDRDELWLNDDEGVSRIAIVGDPEWKIPVLTVIAQPLRRIPIGYFATEMAGRRWLDRPARGAPVHAAAI
jgi:hypothetical protein